MVFLGGGGVGRGMPSNRLLSTCYKSIFSCYGICTCRVLAATRCADYFKDSCNQYMSGEFSQFRTTGRHFSFYVTVDDIFFQNVPYFLLLLLLLLLFLYIIYFF